MIREAMPTFFDKDLGMGVKYQKATDKAKGYEREEAQIFHRKRQILILALSFELSASIFQEPSITDIDESEDLFIVIPELPPLP